MRRPEAVKGIALRKFHRLPEMGATLTSQERLLRDAVTSHKTHRVPGAGVFRRCGGRRGDGLDCKPLAEIFAADQTFPRRPRTAVTAVDANRSQPTAQRHADFDPDLLRRRESNLSKNCRSNHRSLTTTGDASIAICPRCCTTDPLNGSGGPGCTCFHVVCGWRCLAWNHVANWGASIGVSPGTGFPAVDNLNL